MHLDRSRSRLRAVAQAMMSASLVAMYRYMGEKKGATALNTGTRWTANRLEAVVGCPKREERKAKRTEGIG